MEEYKALLIELLRVPLIWLVLGLFLIGQSYLFYIRRFGRALIRRLYPYAKNSLSTTYICRSSWGKITIRYKVPAYNPDELQIVMNSNLKGNFHLIDIKLAEQFEDHLKTAKSEKCGRVASLFKLVSDHGELSLPIKDWDSLYTILSEIKSLNTHHIQAQGNKLILGNAVVKQETLEDENKLSELKQNIDRVIVLGRELLRALEYNVSFKKHKPVTKTSDPISIILPACVMFVGLIWFLFVADSYPLIDESQMLIPLLTAMGVTSLLLYPILAIRNKALFQGLPVVVRVFISAFLAVPTTLGYIGPAIHYNAYFDKSEAVRIEGTIIELQSVDNKSFKSITLRWLLGKKYGNQVDALLRSYQVKVRLSGGNVYTYSIPKSLSDILRPKEKVEIFIRDGALSWKWIFQIQPKDNVVSESFFTQEKR